ncbi:MAG: LssY C-terminal domain-containing protein [Halioglobus sp.]
MLSLTGCASFSVPDGAPEEFIGRAEIQESADVEVRAAVLSEEEAKVHFSSRLPRKHIQPVWLQIENHRDEVLILNPLALDKDYFSPSEAAWKSRGWGERKTDAKVRYFYEQHIPLRIPARSSVTGFVYTNLDPSAKSFTVQLHATEESLSFDFVMLVPGFEADFMRFDTQELEPEEEGPPALDLQGLHDYLGSLPCCVNGGDEVSLGDPLNLVLVGQGDHVLASLVRRGWDLTEILTTRTAWKTVRSSLFASRYRTSPVSPLYLYGRPQDAALQKVRQNVDERNHLRLWRAPVTFEGKPVWVGQISRDIGIKFSSKTLVTHRIDPFIDEARNYILLDLLESQYVAFWGYVKGVEPATTVSPRYNYTKDPYYTDGLRVVMLLGEEPLNYNQIHRLDWEKLPPRVELVDEAR